MVMRQAQGQAGKLIGMSGSGPAMVARVRHSPLTAGQFHGGEAVKAQLGNQPTDLVPDQCGLMAGHWRGSGRAWRQACL